MNNNHSEPEILEEANHALELTWSSVFGFSEESHNELQTQLAARRLLSYNPQSRVVEEKLPQFYNAVNSLCPVIKSRIKELDQSETVDKWKTLLFCYLLMNDMPNAYTAAAHTLRLQPDISDPYFNYCAGIVYQHFHYYEDAIKFYKRPSDRFEQNIDRNFRLAIAYRSLSKYPESESLFRNLLKHPPPNLKPSDIKLQLSFNQAIEIQKPQNYMKNYLRKIPDAMNSFNNMYGFYLFKMILKAYLGQKNLLAIQQIVFYVLHLHVSP